MICIVDYGVGNIQAFLNTFKSFGLEVCRASKPEHLTGVKYLVLPGVGHFDHAMERLNNSGIRPKLEEAVLGMKVPIMGVCVGMQMLATGSDEGVLPGLNWVPGHCREFAGQFDSACLPMPHMGWNKLQLVTQSELFSEYVDHLSQFYFLHSYHFVAEDRNDVVARAVYGQEFDAVVSRGHIHGVQFHPEKSHHCGEQLLKNFVGIR